MNQDCIDAQELCDLAGMLAACTTEAGQYVLRRSIAPGFGEGPNWPAHGLVRDLDEPARALSKSLWTDAESLTRIQSRPAPDACLGPH